MSPSSFGQAERLAKVVEQSRTYGAIGPRYSVLKVQGGYAVWSRYEQKAVALYPTRRAAREACARMNNPKESK